MFAVTFVVTEGQLVPCQGTIKMVAVIKFKENLL